VSISAVIPNLNSGALLDRCLDALDAQAEVDEVLVVDAGSTDGSAQRAAERELVRVISAPGTSIQARLNLSLEEARNEYVLLLNSDAFVDPQTPAKLVEVLDQRPEVGASGACLRFEDGSPQKSSDRYKTLLRETLAALPGGRRFTGFGRPDPKAHGIDPVTWLPLCCAVVRRSAGREIGGWDERFTFFYEDQDFCRRLAEAGWGLAIRWDAGAIHVGGGSTGTWKSREPSEWFVRLQENRILYLQKWYPHAWRAFAVVWLGRSWMHVVLWRARAVRSRLQADRDGARRAQAWARMFRRAARP
jgi:N-acetylglucosaminyl-diphospho-decaprenol L-rhamnosyltransferase